MQKLLLIVVGFDAQDERHLFECRVVSSALSLPTDM